MSVPSAVERPQLRPYLDVAAEDTSGRRLVLHDLLRLNGHYLRLTPPELRWLPLFDGTRPLREIQADAVRLSGGEIIPLDRFSELASAMDQALFLEGPRYRAAVDDPVRRPVCVGTY